MPHDVFISYSSKDKAAADAVRATLEQHNVRCWIAPRDILPGMDWTTSIIEAIEDARVMVLLISSSSNSSRQIEREVHAAADHDVIIVPVRIQDVPPARNLQFFLSAIHWLDAITPPFEKHLDNVAEKIRLLLDRPVTPRDKAANIASATQGRRRADQEQFPSHAAEPAAIRIRSLDHIAIILWPDVQAGVEICAMEISPYLRKCPQKENAERKSAALAARLNRGPWSREEIVSGLSEIVSAVFSFAKKPSVGLDVEFSRGVYQLRPYASIKFGLGEPLEKLAKRDEHVRYFWLDVYQDHIRANFLADDQTWEGWGLSDLLIDFGRLSYGTMRVGRQFGMSFRGRVGNPWYGPEWEIIVPLK
jgi:hypothetical protein